MILAISHPLRRRMLRVLADSDEPISLDQLTREFDLPVGTARYHANVLCGFGAAEPTRPDPGDDRDEYLYDATIEGQSRSRSAAGGNTGSRRSGYGDRGGRLVERF